MTAVTGAGWDAQRRSDELGSRREELLRRLPRLIRQATHLSEDVRELIVDDSIEFATLHYEPRIDSPEGLERVFWDAAQKRVLRAREQRYATVRAGYARADLAALDALADGETPEDETLTRAELSAALEFAATLAPTERRVWVYKHTAGGRRPPGATQIARRLGLPLGVVRTAERTIEDKRSRYAAIYAAGRVCSYFAPAVAALAAGDTTARLATAARLHVSQCPTCCVDYTRQLRYLHSARFNGKVASLLPVPAPVERLRLTGMRDLITDWTGRLLGHDPTATAGQLAAGGAGRGLGTAAALKLATLCLGAGTLGACVATGVIPFPIGSPTHHHTPAATATPTATPQAPTRAEPPMPHGGATLTPTPTPRPARSRGQRTSDTAPTQGGTGPTSHEHTPASTAPSGSKPNGGSEFDPTSQTGSPQPAPVPAAPGGSEFQ